MAGLGGKACLMINSIKLNLSKWRKPHESVFLFKAKSSGSYQIATLTKNELIKRL